jgi:hypothetical protein
VFFLLYKNSLPEGITVRFASLKLSILSVLAVIGLSLVPAASADSITFGLTQNNLGISGSLGTVKVTDLGGGGVSVTITMASGYGVFMNNQNGKGGKLFVTTSGSLTSGSISGLSFGSVTGFSSKGGAQGGFSYSDLFTFAGGTSQTTFSFTLSGVSTKTLSSLGLHFICLNGNCPGSNSNTGFVETGGPSTVPEPGTLALLGTGLVGLAGVVRRRFVS